jgi:hypothetical protein
VEVLPWRIADLEASIWLRLLKALVIVLQKVSGFYDIQIPENNSTPASGVSQKERCHHVMEIVDAFFALEAPRVRTVQT